MSQLSYAPSGNDKIIHIPAGDTLKKMAYISREAQFQVGKGKGVYTRCWTMLSHKHAIMQLTKEMP